MKREVTISFRISEEDKNRIQEYATQNEMTISQVVRKAVKEFLKQGDI